MKQRRQKPKFGDVYAASVDDKGEAWFIYTHDNDEGDNLVRVLKGFHPPGTFDASYVTRANVQFDMFYNSIAYGLKKGSLRLIAHVEIPEELRDFPLFRERTTDVQTMKKTTWWVYDKDKRYQIDSTDPRLPHLSGRSLVNHPSYLDKLRFGWTPEIAFANGWS